MSYEVATKHNRLSKEQRPNINMKQRQDSELHPTLFKVSEGHIGQYKKKTPSYNNGHPVVVEGFWTEGGAGQLYSTREEKEGQNTWKKGR